MHKNTIEKVKDSFAKVHGNRYHHRIKSMSDINPMTKKTYQEHYDYTLWRHNLILSHGFTIVFAWEREWKVSKKSYTHERFTVVSTLIVEQET